MPRFVVIISHTQKCTLTGRTRTLKRWTIKNVVFVHSIRAQIDMHMTRLSKFFTDQSDCLYHEGLFKCSFRSFGTNGAGERQQTRTVDTIQTSNVWRLLGPYCCPCYWYLPIYWACSAFGTKPGEFSFLWNSQQASVGEHVPVPGLGWQKVANSLLAMRFPFRSKFRVSHQLIPILLD